MKGAIFALVLIAFSLSAFAQTSESPMAPSPSSEDQSILGRYSGSFTGVRGGVVPIALDINSVAGGSIKGAFSGYARSSSCYGNFPMSGKIIGNDVNLVAVCEEGTTITLKVIRSGNKLQGIVVGTSGIELKVTVSK